MSEQATVWQPSTLVEVLIVEDENGAIWSCPATANGWSQKVRRSEALADVLREIPPLSTEDGRRVLLAVGAPVNSNNSEA